MNPMELGLRIMAHTSDPSTNSRAVAINELGVPERVIDVLVARKLLGWAFAKSGCLTNVDAPWAAEHPRSGLNAPTSGTTRRPPDRVNDLLRHFG